MEAERNGASTFGAAMNLTKLCVGCGVLALPHAVMQGGLLFSPIIIAMVG